MNNDITCAEFEILLADYLDGTLHGNRRAGIEGHQAACAACAELAQDAAGAMAFMERAAEVAPPPAMVNRILFEVTSGPSRDVVRPSPLGRWAGPWLRTWVGPWIGNVLQPRIAMGMAMAVLSLAMVGRFWAIADDSAHRAWDRAMKGYENLQLVYDVQSQLQEWDKDGNLNPADDRGGVENK